MSAVIASCFGSACAHTHTLTLCFTSSRSCMSGPQKQVLRPDEFVQEIDESCICSSSSV